MVGSEQGRIKDLRLNDKKMVIGTFTGIGCKDGRTVFLSEAKGANNKSAKQIQAEVTAIQKMAPKNKPSAPGDKDAPRVN